jgi:predicted MPP superfamily phosphohydrolase
MAPPAIALRFRDTTSGIDSIEQHRAIVGRAGTVAWGWWKKAFEDADVAGIADRIAGGRGVDIVLIDTTTKRAFTCRCEAFLLPDAAPRDLVPEYYRDRLLDIAGLFMVGPIADAEYPAELAAKIGEQTFLWIGEEADPAFKHGATEADAAGRSCILHLSDLHFGDDYAFRREGESIAIGDSRDTLTEALMKDLTRLGYETQIAAIIVTGDFVTKGRWDGGVRHTVLTEFEALRAALDLKSEQIVAVPGNHDVVRYPDGDLDVTGTAVEKQTNYEHEIPFRFFVNELVGRDVKASLNYVRRIRLANSDLDICVLNSCTITSTKWTEYGYVGASGLEAIRTLGEQPIKRPTHRFLALHHHLLPVAAVEAPSSRGVTLTLDASQLLAAAQTAGVNVALHGHQHKPKIARYQMLPLNGEGGGDALHVVASGSTGARNGRLPYGERNAYCLFRLAPDAVELWIRELRLDGVAGAQIFRGVLDSVALQPASS